MPKVTVDGVELGAYSSLGLGLLICVATASAEPPTGSRIDPAPSAVTDTANKPVARRAINQFARCVADTRAEWADQILDLPFTSDDQMRQVVDRVSGADACLATWQFDLKLSSISLLGGMAESRILKRHRSAAVASFRSVSDDQLFSSEAAPRNTGEDFAMCLARKDPHAVRALIETVPATDEENSALGKLIPHLSNCISQGTNIKLNRPTIRSHAAFGLYRLLTKYAVATRPDRGRN